MSQARIEQLIQTYNLQPHREGGYYCERYRSDSKLASPVDAKQRASVSHIYFLLVKGQVSRWHKVLHDEIWNMYEGAPLRILSLKKQIITDEIIGRSDNSSGQDFFKVIKGGDYQAAESTGDFSFLGCTVAPGFEFRDFSFIQDQHTKDMVVQQGHDYAKFF